MKEKYTLGPVEFVGTLHDMVKDNPFQWRKVANLMYKFWVFRNPGLQTMGQSYMRSELEKIVQSIYDTVLPDNIKVEILRVIINVMIADKQFLVRVGFLEHESEYFIPFNPWL